MTHDQEASARAHPEPVNQLFDRVRTMEGGDTKDPTDSGGRTKGPARFA